MTHPSHQRSQSDPLLGLAERLGSSFVHCPVCRMSVDRRFFVFPAGRCESCADQRCRSCRSMLNLDGVCEQCVSQFVARMEVMKQRLAEKLTDENGREVGIVLDDDKVSGYVGGSFYTDVTERELQGLRDFESCVERDREIAALEHRVYRSGERVGYCRRCYESLPLVMREQGFHDDCM